MRIPKHVGIIPDGNRRWALQNGMNKENGYSSGINPGYDLFKLCQEKGIQEITYYGYTCDNTKRPTRQRIAFTKACIEAVKLLSKENAELLVKGNSESEMFPIELTNYLLRKKMGTGGIKVNFLVNYSWEWDLNKLKNMTPNNKGIIQNIHSSDISRIDLIVRWGGRRRLSGFLPVQSIYSDFYVIEDYWPEFRKEHFEAALNWYNNQDITLGG